MSHFAKVLNGIVTQLIVAEPEFFDTFIDNSPGTWIQTSYNTRGGIHYDPTTGEPSQDQSKALRKNFAGIGWLLDEFSCTWEAPIPTPTEGGPYTWDEANQSWVEI